MVCRGEVGVQLIQAVMNMYGRYLVLSEDDYNEIQNRINKNMR